MVQAAFSIFFLSSFITAGAFKASLRPDLRSSTKRTARQDPRPQIPSGLPNRSSKAVSHVTCPHQWTISTSLGIFCSMISSFWSALRRCLMILGNSEEGLLDSRYGRYGSQFPSKFLILPLFPSAYTLVQNLKSQDI